MGFTVKIQTKMTFLRLKKTTVQHGGGLFSRFVAFLFSFIFLVAPALNQVSASGPSSNRVLNYQLRLTDANGIAVADGTKNLKLTLKMFLIIIFRYSYRVLFLPAASYQKIIKMI